MRITVKLYEKHSEGKCVGCIHYNVCSKVKGIRKLSLGKVTFDCHEYKKEDAL